MAKSVCIHPQKCEQILAWTIKYTEHARKTLRKMDKQNAKRIVDFMEQRIAIADNPRQFGKPLVGPLNGYWRYRVGDYRILCRIDDGILTVTTAKIGHRSDVYGD